MTLTDLTPETDTADRQDAATEAVNMRQYRRYLDAVRTFLLLRAEAGDNPTRVLGARDGAWAHKLMDRLLVAADDAAFCQRETLRLEASIEKMQEIKTSIQRMRADG